jgi:hypothetical protein
MDDVCVKTSDKLTFMINIFVHVIILFGFLTLLFNFVISKVMVSAFQNEIGHIIHDNLGKELKDKYNQLGDQTKNILKSINLTKLENELKKPSKYVQLQNAWIKRSAVVVTFILAMMVAMMIFLVKYTCNTCVPIFDIIKENIVVFTFIGIVEYMFFTKIAMKFIPAPPSLMVKTFIDALKQEIKS